VGGFDWIIAAIFLVSVLVGIMRGFIKESLSIISWIVAIWLAMTFCVQAGDFVGQYIEIPNLKFRKWAGFSLIFIGTLFLFAFASYVITKLFVRGPIKGTDRVLGIGFGAVRAAAIVVAVVIVTRGLGMENSDWWKNSQYLSKFVPFADYVEALMPKDWQSDPQSDETLKDKAIKKTLENLPISSTTET
jgi:membrane protein required for colicin V production